MMSNSEQAVSLDFPSGGCAIVTLNRPAVRNALSSAVVEELLVCVDMAEGRDDVHTLVLQGNGPSFCSGLDLGTIGSETDASLTWRLLRIETLLQRIFASRLRILSLAHGYAFGTGADILVASQRRIVDPAAKVRIPGAQFGICLGFCRLSHVIGPAAAMEVVDEGKTLSASEALAIGLASGIVEKAKWPEMIEQLGSRPPRIHPHARSTYIKQMTAACAEKDMAAIARTASLPGLKERIRAYVG